MAWPAAIRIQTRPDGARYELPVRDLGALKFFGFISIGMGLVFSAITVGMFLKIFSGFAENGSFFEIIFSLLFVVPFFIGCCVPLAIGLLLVRGRCQIELNRGTVFVREQFGPFFWRRKHDLKGLEKLSIAIGGTRVNGRPVTSGPLADLSALSAVFPGRDKPWPIAIGYPLDWMRELSVDLAQRLHDTGIPVSIEESSGKLRVVEENWNADTGIPGFGNQAPAGEAIPAQPAGSLVKVQPHGDGIMLTVPPMGLVKGSKGLFFFSLIWCGFIGCFTAIMIGGALAGKAKDLWAGLAFTSVFWAVGIGMFLAALNMGRRRAMLLANSREFKVVRQSPFGVKQWAWPTGEVTDVRLGPSGMTVNNRSVNELQVFAAGSKTGLFSERDDAELIWMAAVIRQALRVRRTDENNLVSGEEGT